MNNSELDAKLKAAREPALPADYAEAFPQTVLNQLRSSPWKPVRARRFWLPRLVWGAATTACLLIAFALGHWRGQVERDSGQDVLANVKLIQETLAMFPNRVRAIVEDGHGLKLVLADQPDVPASMPIYIRICDGKHCSSLVTFSGQEIQIAGQKLTVLSDANGGIILEGNQFVWSSREPVHAGRSLKIEAKNL
jgi:hypothetical protein